MDRWNWTWEEPRPAAPPEQEPAPDPAAGSAAEPASARSGEFRRRRIGAAIVVVAVLALLIAAVARSGPHHADRASIQHSATRHAAAARLSAAQQDALADRREGRAIDRVLSYTPAVTRGGTKGNEVALTFDDGPGPYTERLVSVLNSLGVRATFFAIGEEEQYFSGGTRLELRSGDVVGDHTETHPMLASLSRHDQHESCSNRSLGSSCLAGSRPRLFRPPYGSFNATTFQELHAMRLLMVLWSTDTGDYTMPGVQAIVQRALAGAHPGAIILMHDAGGDRLETIEALPAIIARAAPERTAPGDRPPPDARRPAAPRAADPDGPDGRLTGIRERGRARDRARENPYDCPCERARHAGAADPPPLLGRRQPAARCRRRTAGQGRGPDRAAGRRRLSADHGLSGDGRRTHVLRRRRARRRTSARRGGRCARPSSTCAASSAAPRRCCSSATCSTAS